ncbi:MAG: hypothetical protein ACW967_10845 [Candidatus Hodarchaeales archaeon]|jgi:hypothetical protein
MDDPYLRIKDLVTMSKETRNFVENKMIKGEWQAYRQDYILKDHKPINKTEINS